MIRLWPWSRFYLLEQRVIAERTRRKRLRNRVRQIERIQRDHALTRKRREWWVTKVIFPTGGLLIAFLTVNTATHWI